MQSKIKEIVNEIRQLIEVNKKNYKIQKNLCNQSLKYFYCLFINLFINNNQFVQFNDIVKKCILLNDPHLLYRDEYHAHLN